MQADRETGRGLRAAESTSEGRAFRSWSALFALCVGAATFPLFYRQVSPSIDPQYWDLPTHLQQVLAGMAGRGWPVYPVFHLLVGLLDHAALTLGVAAGVVLAAAVALRVFVTCSYLESRAVSKAVAALGALTLLLAAPCPNWWRPTWIYLGQLSGAIWHNPTTVVAMPLALALFAYGQCFLDRPAASRAGIVSILMVAGVLAKPSYVMVFVPVFLAASIGSRLPADRYRPLRLASAAIVPAVAVLLWQWQATYRGADTATVVWAPLEVWRYYSPNVVGSVLLSTVFPLTFAVLYGRRAIADRAVAFAWSAFVLATLLAATLNETGSRALDANWFWGAHISLAVLFMASCGRLADVFEHTDWRAWVAAGALGAHAAVGFAYVVRLTGGGLYF